ncbi:MAG: type II secretion system F family protein [Bacteroidetes bacterium]|nr:type II secretion system F family protein [Bacteroidota bacterium]
MTKIEFKKNNFSNNDNYPYDSKKNRSIKEAFNKDIDLFGSSFSDKKKERFYSELSILFSSGVDIRSALELIEDEQVKEKDRLLFQRVKEDVIAGSSLSNAMEKTGKFSSYEFYSIRIGEESGRLPQVLAELSLFFGRKIKLKRQLISALSYPAILFFTTFGAVFFMMRFVVPMFSDVFRQFKTELPYFTKLLIKVSNGFTQYSGVGLVIFFLIIATLFSQRKSKFFRKFSAGLVLRIPVLKDLVSKIYLARFCQSMNLLISAKTPLVASIDLVKSMVSFYPIESSLDKIREDVLRGEPLFKSMGEFKIYNKRMISLIKVAEEVNQLDKMFERIAKQYSDEVEHQTSILGSLIEPVLIIILGIIIGGILVAIYLPMFQLGTAVG